MDVQPLLIPKDSLGVKDLQGQIWGDLPPVAFSLEGGEAVPVAKPEGADLGQETVADCADVSDTRPVEERFAQQGLQEEFGKVRKRSDPAETAEAVSVTERQGLGFVGQPFTALIAKRAERPNLIRIPGLDKLPKQTDNNQTVEVAAPQIESDGSFSSTRGAQLALAVPPEERMQPVLLLREASLAELSEERTIEGVSVGSPSVVSAVRSIDGAPLPEGFRPVSVQIVEAARAAPKGEIELVLQPEELGTVKLKVRPTEHGMVVHLAAERAETLDLMRRNLDVLLQDFRSLGFGPLTFAFGSERRGGGHLRPAAMKEMGRQGIDPRETMADVTPLTLQAGRLDIRI